MLRLVVKLVVGLTLVAAVIHEGGQLMFAQTKADDIAHQVAQTGAEVFADTKNVSRAQAAAKAEAADAGARLRAFNLLPDGKATVRVAVTASTLIVRRVSFLRRYGVRRATVTAGPPVL